MTWPVKNIVERVWLVFLLLRYTHTHIAYLTALPEVSHKYISGKFTENIHAKKKKNKGLIIKMSEK